MTRATARAIPGAPHQDGSRGQPQNVRVETDTFGPIEVEAHRYWGAQTQRSLQNFKIGGERMSPALVRALGIVKLAAARVNGKLGELDGKLAETIAKPPRRWSTAS